MSIQCMLSGILILQLLVGQEYARSEGRQKLGADSALVGVPETQIQECMHGWQASTSKKMHKHEKDLQRMTLLSWGSTCGLCRSSALQHSPHCHPWGSACPWISRPGPEPGDASLAYCTIIVGVSIYSLVMKGKWLILSSPLCIL